MNMNATIKKKKKKPLSVNLTAALIFALITFFIGYMIPSVIMLDSRIKGANSEISKLQEEIKEKNSEIKTLNSSIKEKDEANIALGNKITENLQTIESLNVKIKELEDDVDFAAEAAMQGEDISDSNIVRSASRLSSGQQLVIIAALFILLIFVISVTCGVIAAVKGGDSKSKEKKKRRKHGKKSGKEMPDSSDAEKNGPDADDEEVTALPEAIEDETPQEKAENITSSDEEESALAESADTKMLSVVEDAINLLYTNKLENAMDDLGGFRFGVTNFDEILSDKAAGKSFGNSENGDFVAFMHDDGQIKKLYIIPRYMTLSDSTVSLRGTVDLFDIIDEDNNLIDHGTVKINTIAKPAAFSFGQNGWAIESKGIIRAQNAH